MLCRSTVASHSSMPYDVIILKYGRVPILVVVDSCSSGGVPQNLCFRNSSTFTACPHVKTPVWMFRFWERVPLETHSGGMVPELFLLIFVSEASRSKIKYDHHFPSISIVRSKQKFCYSVGDARAQLVDHFSRTWSPFYHIVLYIVGLNSIKALVVWLWFHKHTDFSNSSFPPFPATEPYYMGIG